MSIDSFNYKNQLTKFIDGNFFVLKAEEAVKVNVYFKTELFNSDENLFFNNKNQN